MKLEPRIPRAEQPLPELNRDELAQLHQLARLVKGNHVRSVSLEYDRKTGRLRLTTYPHPVAYLCNEG